MLSLSVVRSDCCEGECLHQLLLLEILSLHILEHVGEQSADILCVVTSQ